MVRRILSLVTSVLVVLTSTAHAQASPEATPEGGPEELLTQRIAVWRFDALGIEPELVARLETLFRMELDRLAKQPMPSRRDIERVITADQRECTGEEKCLAAIGKKLGVDIVVTGTVGSLADSFVLNIKAVEAATGTQVQRIQSDPLRGSPDDLIEGVRVAAYRLLAPEQLHGSIQIQSDLVGAQVQLDGKVIGKTPLPRLGVRAKQGLGRHKLQVQAPGYAMFEDEVVVNFQKVSQVVVRLLPSTEVIGTGQFRRIEKRPVYTRTWFLVGLGIAAVAIGAGIGYAAGGVKCIDGRTGSQIGC
ncbi:MAG: PEGA domain-containing protein [Kofleriaceae bacterium]